MMYLNSLCFTSPCAALYLTETYDVFKFSSLWICILHTINLTETYDVFKFFKFFYKLFFIHYLTETYDVFKLQS